ncbi:MAG: ankyrin repeat domain-containing protein [Bacteroidales bacterium]
MNNQMRNTKLLSALLLLAIAIASCGSQKKVADDIFFQAAFDGDTAIINEYLKTVDVNSRDQDSTTALMYAAFNGHLDLAKHLLEKGADVKLVNKLDRSALMFAATSPSAEMVQLLIDKGADVNLGDKEENWTPYLMAAAEGLIKNMDVLEEAGADIMAKDVDGETALDFAMAHQKQEAMVYLIKKGVPSKNYNFKASSIEELKNAQEAQQVDVEKQ